MGVEVVVAAGVVGVGAASGGVGVDFLLVST